MCHKYWLFILLPVGYCHALIVPQELPSILSLIFSTIPQVKKGTDSRIGFGFRLGEHADVQVTLELGPQKETKPIGPDSLSQTSKRNVNQYDYDQGGTDDKNQNDKKGENWLKTWSNGMQAKKEKNNIPTLSTTLLNSQFNTNNNNNNEKHIQVMPLISETALKQLQILYGKNSTTSNVDDKIIKTGNNENYTNSKELLNFKQNINKDQITAELSDVNLD